MTGGIYVQGDEIEYNKCYTPSYGQHAENFIIVCADSKTDLLSGMNFASLIRNTAS